MNAGVDSIGVTYGSHASEELIQYKPKVLVDNAYEIFEWVMRNE